MTRFVRLKKITWNRVLFDPLRIIAKRLVTFVALMVSDCAWGAQERSLSVSTFVVVVQEECWTAVACWSCTQRTSSGHAISTRSTQSACTSDNTTWTFRDRAVNNLATAQVRKETPISMWDVRKISSSGPSGHTKCTRSCLQFGDQILTVLSEASQRDRHCRRCLPETGSTRSTISLEGSAPTLYNRRNQQDCPKCRRRKWLGQRVRTVHVTCGGFSSKFKTHRVASELRILELLRTSTGNDHRQVRTALPSFRHEWVQFDEHAHTTTSFCNAAWWWCRSIMHRTCGSRCNASISEAACCWHDCSVNQGKKIQKFPVPTCFPQQSTSWFLSCYLLFCIFPCVFPSPSALPDGKRHQLEMVPKPNCNNWHVMAPLTPQHQNTSTTLKLTHTYTTRSTHTSHTNTPAHTPLRTTHNGRHRRTEQWHWQKSSDKHWHKETAMHMIGMVDEQRQQDS